MMTENDRRLLAANAAAIKLLLDSLLKHRVAMVDQDRARELSAEIGAALAGGVDEAGAARAMPPLSSASSPLAGWVMGWWVRRRIPG
jgi:hypothetical protein